MPDTFSPWVVTAVNLLPLGGVLFLGWDLFSVMVMYWLEAALILLTGMVQVFWNGRVTVLGSIAMLLYSPIYLGPAAAAVVGYGIAVIVFFYRADPIEQWADFPPPAELWALVIDQWLWVPALALIASYVFRFVNGWIVSGAYRDASLLRVMLGLYGRVIVLQIVTIALAAVIVESGQRMLALTLVVAGKCLLDLAIVAFQRRGLLR